MTQQELSDRLFQILSTFNAPVVIHQVVAELWCGTSFDDITTMAKILAPATGSNSVTNAADMLKARSDVVCGTRTNPHTGTEWKTFSVKPKPVDPFPGIDPVLVGYTSAMIGLTDEEARTLKKNEMPDGWVPKFDEGRCLGLETLSDRRFAEFAARIKNRSYVDSMDYAIGAKKEKEAATKS